MRGRSCAILLLRLGLAASVPALMPPAARAEATGTIRVATPQVRAIDGITVDVDASALRDSSNLRLVVLSAEAPDAVADVNAFAGDAVKINAARVRLTLPAGPPGRDEVRLYHIPRLGTAYEVAARAPVEVAPGVAGAVRVHDLASEARRLGPVRFEAQYRDARVRLQAQFLRVRPDTEWDTRWFGGAPVAQAAHRFAVVSLGIRGVVPDRSGATDEVICVVDADAADTLQRVASLSPGDGVLVSGNPSTWAAAGPRDPVILRGCRLADR